MYLSTHFLNYFNLFSIFLFHCHIFTIFDIFQYIICLFLVYNKREKDKGRAAAGVFVTSHGNIRQKP